MIHQLLIPWTDGDNTFYVNADTSFELPDSGFLWQSKKERIDEAKKSILEEFEYTMRDVDVVRAKRFLQRQSTQLSRTSIMSRKAGEGKLYQFYPETPPKRHTERTSHKPGRIYEYVIFDAYGDRTNPLMAKTYRIFLSEDNSEALFWVTNSSHKINLTTNSGLTEMKEKYQQFPQFPKSR